MPLIAYKSACYPASRLVAVLRRTLNLPQDSADYRAGARHWDALHFAPGATADALCQTQSSIGKEARMLDSKILDDVSARVAAAFAASPARDAEKNLKAMLTGALAKLDLVTREEFDVQARVLLRTREKLEALEARVAELEARAAKPR
jgi:ubiquinone biosynthesis accessory factor UbiK